MSKKHWREPNGPVHCESNFGIDYTLCGFSMDGDEESMLMTETHEDIDCENCIGIINFCKRVRSSEIKLSFQRRKVGVGNTR